MRREQICAKCSEGVNAEVAMTWKAGAFGWALNEVGCARGPREGKPATGGIHSSTVARNASIERW